MHHFSNFLFFFPQNFFTFHYVNFWIKVPCRCELSQLTSRISCSLPLQKKSYKMLKMVPRTAERWPPPVILMEKNTLQQPIVTNPRYELLVISSSAWLPGSPHFYKPKAPEIQNPKHTCLPIPPSRSKQSIKIETHTWHFLDLKSGFVIALKVSPRNNQVFYPPDVSFQKSPN